MMKTTIDTAMKPTFRPGIAAIASARSCEKPDWVSDQAMAVAAPMMSRIAPEREAVSTSMGSSRRQSNWR